MKMNSTNADTIESKKNAIKETIQELTLYGLAKTDFFDNAAFYGETALRIFHGLDRFSEDLDFSLVAPDPDFNLNDYIPGLEETISSFGLEMSIKERSKNVDSDIQSAFHKGNTRELIMNFYDDNGDVRNIVKDDSIKVKFEIDTNPPEYATFEKKFAFNPYPFSVNLYDESSLFAGKIHALLCRKWKNRIKGRDLYDYLFYIKNNVSVNLEHLNARMIQTGFIPYNTTMNIESLREILCEKFEEIDYEQAKKDVVPFISDEKSIEFWSPELFTEITKKLK